jgi:hypothetical protein
MRIDRPLHEGDALPIEPPEDEREPSGRLQWIGLAVFAIAGVIAILLVTTGDQVPVAALPRH